RIGSSYRSAELIALLGRVPLPLLEPDAQVVPKFRQRPSDGLELAIFVAPAVHRLLPAEAIHQVVILVVLATDDEVLVRPRDVIEEPASLLGADEAVELDDPLRVVREVPLGNRIEPRRLFVQQPARILRHELTVEPREWEAEGLLYPIFPRWPASG